jgi:predicted nucleic acid-binding protein
MNPDRFDEVRKFFAKHDDKEWSFTDCFSFDVMKERNIRQALTSDRHFSQAGVDVLLAH